MTDLAAGPLAPASVSPTFRLSAIRVWDFATAAVVVALLILVVTTFRAYGVSNDEWVQHHYGELIVRYYASGFTDRALFAFDNLYLYGGLFDVAAVLLHRVVPLELYDLRHLMTALIGIGGIGAAALMARQIAGARAGFLAALGLAVSGCWYGTMFTHTKDIPLAAAMTGASYFLLRATRDLPTPRWRDMIGLGLFTGCALGIKVLGLLLPVYAGVAVLARLLQNRDFTFRGIGVFLASSFPRFGVALVIATAIMLAAWPWAALSPLNCVRGLFQFADFHYHITTELAGQYYEMASVPRWYVPIYLAIRDPLMLLVPAVLTALLVMMPLWNGSWFTRQRRRETAFVIFMIVFPLACQVIGHGPAFTGLRHFTFVLPPIAVVAAIGLEAILVALTRLHWGLPSCAFAAMLAGFGWTAGTLYQLHPYEYLYYNQLVGGLQGASRRYVTDYWVATMPAAVSELAAFLKHADSDAYAEKTYTVDVCGDRAAFERELTVQHLHDRLRWTSNWEHADFFIAPTHGDCDGVLNGNVIARIERMGTLIAVVKDRRDTTEHPAVAQLGRKG